MDAKFGPFEFTADQKLRRGGEDIALGGRAKRLLAVLLARPGEIVTHRDLLSAGWPETDIEASSLRAHVRVLRKALEESGTSYVVNEHGRGYRFVAPVEFSAAVERGRNRHSLPPVPNLIGRDDELSEIIAALGSSSRVVSLVGPGGVGKSTLSAAVAARLRSEYADDVVFVDLAGLQPGSDVIPLVAHAVAMEVRAESARQVAEFLALKRCLLVLDNCEHLISSVSVLTNLIVEVCPGVDILITTREPIRARGELSWRLGGLDYADPSLSTDPVAVQAYPSTELFLERARQSDPSFKVTDSNATVLSTICRELDGVPLALEIAASWVGFSGLVAIAEGIHDRLLTMPSDLHPARHRSLDAVLDWSYQLLSVDERKVFRALSVFQTGFSRASAERLLALGGFSPRSVPLLDTLVEKSIVTFDPTIELYRIAEGSKAFARQKLAENSSYGRVMTAHLLWCVEQLTGVEAALATLPRSEWMGRYSPVISDVVAALTWSLRDGGDWASGVECAVRFAPLALQVLGHNEAGGLLRLALQRAFERGDISGRESVELSMRLGMIANDQKGDHRQHSATFDLGIGNEGFESLAQRLMSGFASAFTRGDYPEALKYALRFDELADSRGEDVWVTLSARVLAQCYHFLGSHDLAEQYAQSVIEAPFEFLPTSHISHRVSARIVLSRIAFIKGRDDIAERYGLEALHFAQQGNATAICQSLSLGRIPILIWQGRNSVARKAVDLLLETAEKANLPYWHLWGEAFRLTLEIGEEERNAKMGAFLEINEIPPKLADTLPTLDPKMLLPSALQRSRTGTVGWNGPEVIRAESFSHGLSAAQAEALAQSALELAESQGAHAWVRTARETLDRHRAASLSSLQT